MSFVDCEYMKDKDFEKNLKTFEGKAAITHGHREGLNPCEMSDMNWNYTDQLHRLYVHALYGKTLRLVRQKNFTASLTKIKLLGIPFTILITDARLKEGFYYQMLTLFHLIHVHIFCEHVPKGKKCLGVVDWYIVSHPFFKFLHSYLSKKYLKVIKRQGDEDMALRLRRTELREKGYSFISCGGDFIESNSLAWNVLPPKLKGEHHILLHEVSRTDLKKVNVGPIDFLIRRDDDDNITVWPDVCPHEGASLAKGRVCQGQIKCAWHGIRFKGAKLSKGKPRDQFGNYEFRLESHTVVIREKMMKCNAVKMGGFQ
jgi:nitrite reductase/ring-hydroxylating ferredoxin subunit